MILKVVQLTSRLAKAFDKVVEVLGVIGENLPEFDRYAKLFEQDAQVRKILCLFYQDILDVHVTLLKFFGGSGKLPNSLNVLQRLSLTALHSLGTPIRILLAQGHRQD